ncbi:hypothetical protein K2173_021572 [Erythroxylum novogranatense]|uniref:heme oxygenase (biliverdin-producing) n=1 Tax=Erythroxylum novogranatense TaxID=1862640 RepID=A0AAV8TR92_9ROSI|nr:hypothetical protein K2173_021572 [Erythroxylum novogranatense]
MASFTPTSSQSNSLSNKICHLFVTPSSTNFQSGFVPKKVPFRSQVPAFAKMPPRTVVVVMATTAETPKKWYSGVTKGFVEELRFVAMKLHTREQAKEGEKEVKQLEEQAYSKFVYDTLEEIVQNAAYPFWVSPSAITFNSLLLMLLKRGQTNMAKSVFDEMLTRKKLLSDAQYLKDLSEKDPQAFICHFYNIYFAHIAGGRMIRKKVSEKILEGKDLEFYKWDGDISQLLKNVRDKLNKVAESWTREEKNHCLEETEKSFKYSGDILQLILS